MKIDTTLNIHIDYLQAIEDAAEKTGVSRNDITIMLLKEAIRNRGKLIKYGKAVSYQKRAPKKMWKVRHLYLSKEDYEHLTDVRKFLKNSVSLFLAFAVRDYLDKIVQTLLGANPKQLYDNYLYFGYISAIGVYFMEVYGGKSTTKLKH